MMQPPILCMDLIVEILSWLPVKSLVRFRCVSKSFKSLTSNSSFAKLHLQRSQKNASNSLLFKMSGSLKHCTALSRSVLENSYPSSSTVTIVQPSKEHHIIGSCNGLICYQCYVNHDLFYSLSDAHTFDPALPSYQKYLLYLWNPVTKLRSKNFPSLLVYGSRVTRFGFGYDSLSDTYKVVATIFNCYSRDMSSAVEVKVCSIGDDCWRNIQHWPILSISQHIGVYLSGTLNWLTYHSYHDRDQKNLVVSIDLTKETCRQFMLPRNARQLVPGKLGILNDCLSFSYKCKDHLFVWQMKEYGVENSWTQLFRIGFHHVPNNWLQKCLFPILRLTESGGILIMSRSGKQAMLYSQRGNKVEHVTIPSSNIINIYDHHYIPSLVSPCSS